MAGKGDKVRPSIISKQEFNHKWDKIFGTEKCENYGTVVLKKMLTKVENMTVEQYETLFKETKKVKKM